MEDVNKVIFAGAGPGDPELITVKAMKALGSADLIIYAGSLVPEAVLCWKGGKTQVLSSEDMDLAGIVNTIQLSFSKGKKVVRLHTGDPALYGAIFEQMRELQALNIPYEVIPGVTAAFAASARMRMEYTLPEETQTLILTRISGRTPVPDAEDLDKLAAHRSALAIYLSLGQIQRVQSILETHYGKDGICAVAFKVSHPDEKIIYTRIDRLVKTCEENRITRHALIIAGKSVEASLDPSHILSSKLYDSGFSHGYRAAK